VLKPATDGGNVGTVLLSGFGALENGSLIYRVDRHDGQRWRRLRWSTEAALSHAAQHLGASAPAGRWAQSYMHRGMLLQARYDCARGECKPGELRRQHGLSCGGRGTGCILEVKAHVVFGRLSCIIVEQVPVAFNVSLYATVSDTGVVDCAESDGAIAEARGAENGATPFSCLHFARIVQPQLPALAELAQRLASVYLADWFRLDVFVGHPRLGMRVNEVTYPSHVRDTCALRHWLRQYRTLRLRPTSGRDILARLQRILGVDNATFMLGASG